MSRVCERERKCVCLCVFVCLCVCVCVLCSNMATFDKMTGEKQRLEDWIRQLMQQNANMQGELPTVITCA